MVDFLDIPHPTNRVWPGSPNYVMPTIEEAYKDGLIRGTTWPDDWKHIPGGPWVGGDDRENRFSALVSHEKNVHKAWMKGWHKGFVEYRLNNKIPDWYRPQSDF